MATFESKEHYYFDALQKIEAMCQEDSMDTSADRKFAIIKLIQDIATDALNHEPELQADVNADIQKTWHEMTHIQRALTMYYQNTHPSIIWGMREVGNSVAHAVSYHTKSWCGENGFSYIVANPEQSGISKCSRCIRLLEENGIEDY